MSRTKSPGIFMKFIVLLFVLCIQHCEAFGQRIGRQQVAVLAVAGNEDSQRLAASYCEKRGIESSRILSLDIPAGDELDREVWEQKVRPAIRQWLLADDARKEIGFLVTTFGVPLSISAYQDDQEARRWTNFYDAAIDSRIKLLNQSLQTLASLAGQDFVPVKNDLAIKELETNFNEMAIAAKKKSAGLDETQRKEVERQLQNIFREVAGLAPFVNAMKAQLSSVEDSNTPLVAQFERIVGLQTGLGDALSIYDRIPPSYLREISIMKTLEKSAGLLGVVRWLRNQSELVSANDSAASFDSELCLVGVDDYRRSGSYPITESKILAAGGKNRIYEVTRLDGPTIELAAALVDRAILLDRQGIPDQRNVFIDKRGLPQTASLKDLTIESWLERMATRFRNSEGFTVTVDEGPDLFGEGACPETSIYLGWYGLGKFRDSFTFQPGATAYHLSPGDALGIHDPADGGWCKGFLEKGATFVVGSISDPVVIGLEGGAMGSDPDFKPLTETVALRPRRVNCSDGSVIFGDFLYGKE